MSICKQLQGSNISSILEKSVRRVTSDVKLTGNKVLQIHCIKWNYILLLSGRMLAIKSSLFNGLS